MEGQDRSRDLDMCAAASAGTYGAGTISQAVEQQVTFPFSLEE